MKDGNQGSAIFLNGRAQIIEMLQHMGPEEKGRILKLIKIKNPILAEELYAKSISFLDIQFLSVDDLRKIAISVKPAIFGMALKNLDAKIQKKFLSSLPREYAESAFEIMSNFYTNEKDLAAKARLKILEIAAKITIRSRIS